MFNNQRYMTKGIAEELPLELQLYLWSMIDGLKNPMAIDYLQVFKLDTINENCQILQRITHIQECVFRSNGTACTLQR